MTSTNDSFIDEVTEEVRRERLSGWFRRYGWLVVLALLVVIGGAAWYEWRRAQAEALAELRGEVLLTALEIEDGQERVAALTELPVTGREGVVTLLLLASEQESAGDTEAAIATLDSIAATADADPLYRDLAMLKAQAIRGPNADPAVLEALAAPGAPYRLLALEQQALANLAGGDVEAARAGLAAILEDADLGDGQRDRVTALLTAIAAPAVASPVEAATAPATETAPPAVEPVAPADPAAEPAAPQD